MRINTTEKGENCMLLEFSCSNHKSIKEKIVFSAIASKDPSFENELIDIGSSKVLRSAAIYGANGSGKSNFIGSLDFVKALVINSINHQPGENILQPIHKLSEANSESDYGIQFITKDVRYAYGFTLKENTVTKEYLYYFPKGKQVKIFERLGKVVDSGDKFKSAFGTIAIEALKENRLFLSCAANFSTEETVVNAYLFFKEEIIIYNPQINNWREYSIQLMQDNPQIKDTFVSILQSFGTGIKDVKVKMEKKKFKVEELPANMPEIVKSLLTSQEGNIVDAKIVYDKFETDLMTEESTGIQKLFEIICPIIDIYTNGKILIFDEIENSLHESVVCEIIRMFKGTDSNRSAQLFFTTHDTSLLDLELFRRDQIWFTQMDDDRTTKLYSLTEIKNVRKDENINKGYISGKYGAIPVLNKEFLAKMNQNH